MAEARPAVLVVAHGSAHTSANDEHHEVVSALEERLGVAAFAGFLERADPAATGMAADLAVRGHRPIVVAPALLFSAFHANEDVPLVAGAARSAGCPDVLTADVLGPDPRLVELATQRVADVLGGEVEPEDGLLVVGTGTSDVRAQREFALTAAALGRSAGLARHTHAFASLAEPDVATAVARLQAQGVRRLVLFAWNLYGGVLFDRAALEARAAADAHGVSVVDAGRFGPDPVVVGLIAARCLAALND